MLGSLRKFTSLFCSYLNYLQLQPTFDFPFNKKNQSAQHKSPPTYVLLSVMSAYAEAPCIVNLLCFFNLARGYLDRLFVKDAFLLSKSVVITFGYRIVIGILNDVSKIFEKCKDAS